MYRSTTPTLILNVKNEDFDLNTIDICHVTIESENNLHKLCYTTPTIDVEHKQIRVTMTQNETAMFNEGRVKIQVKAKLSSGAVIPSKIILTNIYEILEEEEL